MQPAGIQINTWRKCYDPNRQGYETFTHCVRDIEKFGRYTGRGSCLSAYSSQEKPRSQEEAS